MRRPSASFGKLAIASACCASSKARAVRFCLTVTSRLLFASSRSRLASPRSASGDRMGVLSRYDYPLYVNRRFLDCSGLLCFNPRRIRARGRIPQTGRSQSDRACRVSVTGLLQKSHARSAACSFWREKADRLRPVAPAGFHSVPIRRHSRANNMCPDKEMHPVADRLVCSAATNRRAPSSSSLKGAKRADRGFDAALAA